MQMWSQFMGRSAIAAVILSAAAAGAFAQQPSLADRPEQIVTAITQPSDRRQLSFEMRGILREEAVKEGQAVKKGDKLLAQDDRAYRAEWEALKLQAESTLEIEFKEKDKALKQSVLKRYEAMAKDNAAASSELEEKQLDLALTETQVKLAEQEKKQRTFEATARGVQVENMTMLSPIDGVVEKILNRVGETTNPEPDRPSIIIVQNDPLWVVMHLPNRQAATVKPTDTFQVRYGESDQWKPAKVQFISPTADARSFKRLVRLEMPNPERVASGHEIQVRLPDHVANAAAGNNPGVASVGTR